VATGQAVAWGYGQLAHSSLNGIAISFQTFFTSTSDDTPTDLINGGGSLTFPDYSRTCIVRGRVIARAVTPGTDSAWDFTGVIRGDGSTAYSWVGVVDPVATVIAQDAGAVTWAVDVSIDDLSIVVTATGEVATDILWMSTIELDEVS
jgi:hypothetical protein